MAAAKLMEELGYSLDDDFALQGVDSQVRQRQNALAALVAEREAADTGAMVPGSKAYNAAQREEALALLAEIREMGGEIPADLWMTQRQKDLAEPAMARANEAFPAEWHEKMRLAMAGRPYKVEPASRGSNEWNRRRIGLSPIEPQIEGQNKIDRCAVHEVAHSFEHALRQLVLMEEAFSEYRSPRDQEALRSLYGDFREMAWADQFATPYSGKKYQHGEVWELFTTGIESLMAGSPYFIRDAKYGGFDNEFRAFILAMLARG